MENNWRQRATLFLAGQTISLLGSSLVQFAITWHITLSTKSGVMLTVSTLCGFLPQVLISLFAGVWADRFDRKKLIILADGTIAVCTGILAILFTAGYQELWLLFFISAVRSMGAGVQMPAVSAFLTEIVPQEKLMKVNGINTSIQGVMMLISPAAAGALYGSLGLFPIFWVDVVTAAVAISLLFVLKVPMRHIPEAVKGGFFKDMTLGIHYTVKNKWLYQFLLFYLFFSLMFGPVVFLTPLMVARSFGEEPWRLVIHEMAFSIGSIAGGIIVGFTDKYFKNKIIMIILFCSAFGLTTFIMGFSQSFVFYLVVLALMGTTMPFVNTGAMTLLQTKVEPNMLGRVFSLVSVISSTAMPLSMVFFGPLADTMQIEHQLLLTGAVMVAISLLMFRFRAVMRAGEPVSQAAEQLQGE